jgi:formate dehydrogenase accessory protein FdhE
VKSGSGPSVWATRRARALRLAADIPHAAEILTVYAKITESQERVAADVPVERWLAAARGTDTRISDPGASGGPLLRLDRLPLGELLPLFTRHLERTVDVGTDVMTERAKRALAAPSDERRALLADAFSGSVAEEPDPESFHARVFLEAVATTLAEAAEPALPPGVAPDSAIEEARGTLRCRVCGGPHVVATLRDQGGALGARALVCGLCGTEQRIRRLTCAHCGETAAERLRVHAAESVPHVRLDECGSCGRYLKTVDLRRRGDAVPVVEELATVELDLWARERGLTKFHENAFGL